MKKPNFKTLLFLLFSLQLSLFAIPLQQDSLYQELYRNHLQNDHFKNKRIFEQITNDTLLMKLAVKFSKNSDRFRYFRYQSMFRIKDKSLITDKMDSISMNFISFKSMLRENDDEYYKSILINSNIDTYIDRLENLWSRTILKKINYFSEFADSRYLNRLEFKEYHFNLLKKYISKEQLKEILKSKDLEPHHVRLFLEYFMIEYFDDLAIIDLWDYPEKVIVEFNILFSELHLKKRTYEIKNDYDPDIIIFDENRSFNDRALALNQIDKNIIGFEFYDKLPLILKKNAVLRIDDEKILYRIHEDTKNPEIKLLTLKKIKDKNIIKDVYQLFENDSTNSYGYNTYPNYGVKHRFNSHLFKNDPEYLQQRFIYCLLTKIDDDNIIYDHFMRKK